MTLVSVTVLPFLVEILVRAAADPLLVLEVRGLFVAAGALAGFVVVTVVVSRVLSPAWTLAVGLALSCWPVLSLAVFELLLQFRRPSSLLKTVAALAVCFGCGLLLAGGIGALAARAFERQLVRRSAVLAVVVLLLADVALLVVLPKIYGRSSQQRPDVLVVILDTTRVDHLSACGYQRATTPALETLTDQGRTYENAWSPAPWTPPAHASILTGLLPAEHGCEMGPLNTAEPTLAEVFSAHGYATLGVVNNPMLGAENGWARGFDEYREIRDPPGASASYVFWLPRLWSEDRRFTGDAWKSLQWIKRWWEWNATRPRFVMLNLLDPHSPYGSAGSEQFLSEDTRRAVDLSHDSEDYDAGLLRAEGAPLRKIIDLYDSDIRHMDDQLGAFFEWLRQRQELDRTIIVVTADHGERLGERGLVGHQLGLDEVLLRVPLIVRYPGRVAAGRVGRPVQTHGIFETVLDLAGSLRRVARRGEPPRSTSSTIRSSWPRCGTRHGIWTL